jgi:hypothetical protein
MVALATDWFSGWAVGSTGFLVNGTPEHPTRKEAKQMMDSQDLISEFHGRFLAKADH